MKNVAIIPARGGSKRIPLKNIRSFFGRPMITYSIEAALRSGIFERVIVSTDSPEIEAIALESGADVPFIRPGDISDDFTAYDDVCWHALNWLHEQGEQYDYACCLLSTAPFMRSEDIKKSASLLSQEVTSIISVTTFPYPIFRALKVENEKVKMVWPEYEWTRSNDLPETYHDAAHFYWVDANIFLKEKKIITDDCAPFPIPRALVQDIDTLEDWETAEILFELLKKRGTHVK